METAPATGDTEVTEATCLIVVPLLVAAVAVAGAAAIFGGERINMGNVYAYLKGRWPYIIAVAGPVVTAAHSYGYLSDGQFAALATLGGSGAVAALRGSLQHLVTDAIMRKVTVQVRQAQAAPLAPEPAPVPTPPPAPIRHPPVPVTPARVVLEYEATDPS